MREGKDRSTISAAVDREWLAEITETCKRYRVTKASFFRGAIAMALLAIEKQPDDFYKFADASFKDFRVSEFRSDRNNG